VENLEEMKSLLYVATKWKHSQKPYHENCRILAMGYDYNCRHSPSLPLAISLPFSRNALIVKVIFQLNSIVYLLIYG
jgi:hypothetical protein